MAAGKFEFLFNKLASWLLHFTVYSSFCLSAKCHSTECRGATFVQFQLQSTCTESAKPINRTANVLKRHLLSMLSKP